MTTIIRKFDLTDAEAIMRLVLQWGHNTTLRNTVETLKKIDALEKAEVFVAEMNPVVVGWIYVAEKVSLGDIAVAEVYGLVVDEDFREQGIGKELIEAAKYWAKENGFTKLILRTNTQRKEANLFYPAIGFDLSKQQNVYVMKL